MIKADLHTHTRHSHGAHSVREMHEAAKAIGLAVHGFSEHSPRPDNYSYPSDYREKLQAEYPVYIAEVQALRRENSADFKTLLGLEVDFIPSRLDFVREATLAADFDYIIGGLHFQDTWGFDSSAQDWNALTRKERHQSYARYYEDLALLGASGLVDIVAHPDLIKIFSVESFRDWLKKSDSQKLVRAALEQIKAADLILEVSSAGLRKPCREIYPGPEIMRLAADLGLKISLASDAHHTEQLAYAFGELESYAASFGFSTYHIVEKRRKQALHF